MADYDSLDPRAGAEPEEEPRKRRLLSLYQMTGNPFAPGSPMERETPQQPYSLDDLGVPPLAPQQATSMQLRGEAPQQPAAPAPRPAGYGGGGGTASATTRSLTSIPTQGPQASREPKDYRAGHQKALDDLDARMAMPDMSEAVNAYRQRYEAAGPDFALGWTMQERGGAGGREAGGQILKNALAARQPQKTDYGTIDQTGFTADPMKQREFNIAKSEKKLALLESIAHNAATEEERRYATNLANQTRMEMARMVAGNRDEARGSRQDSQRFQGEDRMARIYDARTKDYRSELDATRKVSQLAPSLVGRKLNPIEQQSLAVLLNKFLDPGSVVREGEFDRVARAQGLVDRARMLMDKVQRGDFLSPALVQNIIEMSAFYDKASQAKLNQIGDEVYATAQSRGFDPTAIINDPYYVPRAQREKKPGADAGGRGTANSPIVVKPRAAPQAVQPPAGVIEVPF